MKKLIFSVLLASLLSACASDKPQDQKVAVEDRTVSNQGKTQPVDPNGNKVTPPSRITTNQLNPLTDPSSPLSKRSVYYDLDSYSVRDEYKSLVSAHAKYITDNRTAKTLIQGNTDERGSREYNLALGQKRADSVKKMMTLLGVPEAQIESVSLGKEKPRAEGHDEAAWTENRRADILYQGE